ncbi:hypothetical protein [Tsukamurella tyrosinosolvens]|uniref:hypothetical protein n=1 Tax=Tsukamurella tyrosinosolvens TaxID=57704 RepID=UPI000C7E867E|nr:hypothetical protein [Tsukamurella tyrosinosolvens]AUN38652.1 hypothetical protein ASU32_00365 [Tsukamurella tyrosinosolvens]
MSQSHTVTVIGSRFRIEPWTTILRDGGITVTPPHEVQNVTAAVHLATVAQLPKRLMVIWVRRSPFEDASTDAHLRIGRRDPQEVSAAFHALEHGLRVVGIVGEVTSSPRETAAELRELLATAQVPEPA